MTIYTLFTDTNTGAESEVFTDLAKFEARQKEILEDNRDNDPKLAKYLDAGMLNEAWDFFIEEIKDPIDTYSIDEHEIELPSEKTLALAREVERAAFDYFAEFRRDQVGADLAYLLAAILDQGEEKSFVDWSEGFPIGSLKTWAQDHFPPTHAVWNFIIGCKSRLQPE